MDNKCLILQYILYLNNTELLHTWLTNDCNCESCMIYNNKYNDIKKKNIKYE